MKWNRFGRGLAGLGSYVAVGLGGGMVIGAVAVSGGVPWGLSLAALAVGAPLCVGGIIGMVWLIRAEARGKDRAGFEVEVPGDPMKGDRK